MNFNTLFLIPAIIIIIWAPIELRVAKKKQKNNQDSILFEATIIHIDSIKPMYYLCITIKQINKMKNLNQDFQEQLTEMLSDSTDLNQRQSEIKAELKKKHKDLDDSELNMWSVRLTILSYMGFDNPTLKIKDGVFTIKMFEDSGS